MTASGPIPTFASLLEQARLQMVCGVVGSECQIHSTSVGAVA
jgi:hypothetical protein